MEIVPLKIEFVLWVILLIAMISVFVLYGTNQKIQAELNREKRKAIIDELTGLYNRRMLITRFNEEISRLKRNTHDSFFLLVDLDNFKRINDEFGKIEGDKLIKKVAQLLLKKIRIYDIAGTVGRFGGDEFILIITEIPENTAVKRANQILEEINNISINNVMIQASIGISRLEINDSFNDIVKKADDALGEAKERGKNQVVILQKHAVN